MDSKSLMIGDWVNINGDCPMYSVVTSIDQCEIGVCNYLFDADALTPIPLTPEIFEKNGFLDIDKLGVEACCGYDVYHKYDDGYSFNLYPLMKPLYYVHELQHALRLCGLNDEADNFKVE